MQLGAVREDSRGLRILVAIPLRGSIPCNSRSTGRLSVPLCERVAIPLRGSIPCNEGQKALEEARGAESQSPYGAQSLATYLALCNHPHLHVAIPLRGSIPCNGFLRLKGSSGKPRTGRNPLTGLNPLQHYSAMFCEVGRGVGGSQSPYGAQSLATVVGDPLRGGGSRSQSPYGAQSLATGEDRQLRTVLVSPVAIPLRGSIPCN